MEDGSVLILGEGRIAQAVLCYLKKIKKAKRIEFFSKISSEKKVKNYYLIISALPGREAPLGLSLALKYKKNLLDISDLDPPFYLKNKKKIDEAGILVIPGCGFCPGLINFIIGNELFLNPQINSISIKAGSFSPKKFFFPYLWCFDDLILEHQLSGWQIISGKKKRFLPFSGYSRERFLGVDLESYYSVSGFENILDKRKFENFTFRVIRPSGFMIFFNFLKNQGFLDREDREFTKKILESKKEKNFTVAMLDFKEKNRSTISWQIISYAGKNERINSMQKITATVAVEVSRYLLSQRIPLKGLVFMEELGEDRFLFKKVIEAIRDKGIILKRSKGSC